MYDDAYDDREYGRGRSRRDRRPRDDKDYYDDRDYYEDDRHRRPPPPPPPERGRRPPPPPRGAKGPMKVSYKCIGGMIVAIVALILIFVLMNFPWYEISYSYDMDAFDVSGEQKHTYDLKKVTVESNDSRPNISDFKESFSYDDPLIKDSVKDVKNVMDYTYYFYLIAAILLIISIIIIPIVAISKAPHILGIIFLLLALIFILIIPIYYYFSLPPALEKRFDAMDMSEPYNSTFKYNGDFLSSGRGTDYFDYDGDGDEEDEEEVKYEIAFGPGLGFWAVFVPLITIVVAQAVYSAGKRDLAPPVRGPPHGRRPPPPRGRDYDPYDDHPPRRRREPEYDYDEPPPPRQRSKRDYGPPRPMGDEDYDYIQRLQSSRRDDYDYDERPPPRPPRGRGGY